MEKKKLRVENILGNGNSMCEVPKAGGKEAAAHGEGEGGGREQPQEAKEAPGSGTGGVRSSSREHGEHCAGCRGKQNGERALPAGRSLGR